MSFKLGEWQAVGGLSLRFEQEGNVFVSGARTDRSLIDLVLVGSLPMLSLHSLIEFVIWMTYSGLERCSLSSMSDG